MTKKQEEIQAKVEAFYASRKARNAKFSSEAKRALVAVLVGACIVLLIFVSLLWLSRKYYTGSADPFSAVAVGTTFVMVLYPSIAVAVMFAIWKVASILFKLGKKWKKENEERDNFVKELISLGCTRKEIEDYLSELSEVEVKECLDQAFGANKS